MRTTTWIALLVMCASSLVWGQGLTLLTPTGGQHYMEGNPIEVTWTTTPEADSVLGYLSTDDGTVWIQQWRVIDAYAMPIPAPAPGCGIYVRLAAYFTTDSGAMVITTVQTGSALTVMPLVPGLIPPTNLSATTEGIDGINLSWTKPDVAQDIEQSFDTGETDVSGFRLEGAMRDLVVRFHNEAPAEVRTLKLWLTSETALFDTLQVILYSVDEATGGPGVPITRWHPIYVEVSPPYDRWITIDIDAIWRDVSGTPLVLDGDFYAGFSQSYNTGISVGANLVPDVSDLPAETFWVGRAGHWQPFELSGLPFLPMVRVITRPVTDEMNPCYLPTAYRIYRSTSEPFDLTGATLLNTVRGGRYAYTDTGMAVNTDYFYAIQPLYGALEGVLSTVARGRKIDPMFVQINDQFINRGEQVNIPARGSLPVGVEVYRITGTLTFEVPAGVHPSVLTILGGNMDHSVLPGWEYARFDLVEHGIHFDLRGTHPMTDPGVLANALFQVADYVPYNTSVPLHLTDVTINQGIPTRLVHDGIATCVGNEWMVPLQIFQAAASTPWYTLEFGVNDAAGDSFDAHIDVPTPPPPSTDIFFVTFIINDPRFYGVRDLYRDIRNVRDTTTVWAIWVRGLDDGHLTWDPAALPLDLTLSIRRGWDGMPVQMRFDSTFNFAQGETLYISHYRPSAGTYFYLNVKRGWNIISTPLTLIENGVLDVLPNIVSSVYWFEPLVQNWTLADSLYPGRGYMILSPVDTTYILRGIPAIQEELTLTNPAPGRYWHLIGGLWDSTGIAVDTMRITPHNAINPNEVYSYDPTSRTYTHTSFLYSGQGYFVASYASCVWLLTSSMYGRAIPECEPGWSMTVPFATSDARTDLVLGREASAKDGVDREWDRAYPPAAPAEAIRVIWQRDGSDLQRDVVSGLTSWTGRNLSDATVTAGPVASSEPVWLEAHGTRTDLSKGMATLEPGERFIVSLDESQIAPSMTVTPLADRLRIDLRGMDASAIELRDLLGRTLRMVDGSTRELSLIGLAPGYYQVRAIGASELTQGFVLVPR